MDMIGKPGTRITLSVVTAPRAKKYKWYFQEQPVSTEDTSYEGSTTDSLCINKLLPKHKGVYKCVMTGDLNVEMPSRTAYLGIGKFINTVVVHACFNINEVMPSTHGWSLLIKPRNSTSSNVVSTLSELI